MNHLSEEQMIDILMQEPYDLAWRRHLDSCGACRERYKILEEGLQVAQEHKPTVPLMPVPRITFDKYRRASVRNRLSLLAAAALLLVSFTGLDIKVDGSGLHVKFGLPGTQQSIMPDVAVAQAEARLDRLELELVQFKLSQKAQMAQVQEKAEEGEMTYRNAVHVIEAQGLHQQDQVYKLLEAEWEKIGKEKNKLRVRGQ